MNAKKMLKLKKEMHIDAEAVDEEYHDAEAEDDEEVRTQLGDTRENANGYQTSKERTTSRFAHSSLKSTKQDPLRVAAQSIGEHPGFAAQAPTCSSTSSVGEVGYTGQRSSADDNLHRLSFDELLVIMNGRGLNATDCMGKKDMIRKIRNAGNGDTARIGRSQKKQSGSSSTASTSITSAVTSPSTGCDSPSRAHAERQMWVQNGHGPIPRQKSWRTSKSRVE